MDTLLRSKVNLRFSQLHKRVFYEGDACPLCGQCLRYVSTTGCVDCTKLRSRIEWYLRKLLSSSEAVRCSRKRH